MTVDRLLFLPYQNEAREFRRALREAGALTCVCRK